LENRPEFYLRVGPITPEVRRTLAKRLASESIIAETTHFILGFAVAAIFWPILPHVVILTWIGTLYVITIIRVVVRRRVSNFAGIERVPLELRALIVGSGLAWGLGSFLLAPYVAFGHLALIMVVYAGLCAGATTVLLADPRSYYGFLIGLLGPLAAALLLHRGDSDYRAAAILVGLFGLLMAVSYRRAHMTLLKFVQTSDALERSEAGAIKEQKFLDQVIANVPAAIAVLDERQIVQHINPAFEMLFGYSKAEIVGQHLDSMIVPQSERRRSVQLRNQAIQEGSLVAEAVRLRKGGRPIVTEIRAVRVEAAPGSVLAVYEDVTARRQRERRAATLSAVGAALSQARDERALAPTLLRISGETLGWEIGGWWRLDRDTHTTRCDEVWVSRDATRPELAEFIRGSQRSLNDGIVGRAWREKYPTWANDLATAFGLSPDAASGTDWTGAAAAFPIEIEGEVVAVLSLYSGVPRDQDVETRDAMTLVSAQIGATKQRLRAETALREAEARYRQLVEAATDVVWTIDSSGRVTFLNNATNQVFGYSPEQLVGRPFFTITDPESADRDRAAIAHVLSGEEIVGYETASRRAGGGRLHLKISGRPLRDTTGRIVGAQGIAHDISLEVATREALRLASATAQQADAAKSAFLANMSHEIRTPMTGILGTADLILEGELSDEQRKAVELIVSSGETLLTIISDILDLSKIEAGQLELEQTPIDLPRLLTETVALMSHGARAKGIDVALEMGSGLPSAVVGDPTRLRQVLNNLVSNAIKFTSKGRVTVAAARVDGDDLSARIRFSVADTGIGIAPEARDRIFEPFRQGDVSTTRNYGGTGLGLSISRRLVEMMGGALAVDSALGEGSDFHFEITLPLSAVRTESRAERPVPRLAAQALHILIAEDNPVNQQVAGTMLRRRGHAVDIVGNGREAVDAVRKRRYDVVLMDLQMPILDGLQATAEIRQQEEVGQVPIIALTANAASGEIDRCLAAGMNGYVAKPFRAGDLVSAIERVTSSGRSFDEQRPVAASTASDPVDVEGLRAELRDAGAEDALPAVLTVFVGDAPVRMAVISDAIAARDLVRVERAAHAYKSSAGTIRATVLAAHLAEMEKLAKAKGEIGELGILRDKIVAAHDEAIAQLRAWIATQPTR